MGRLHAGHLGTGNAGRKPDTARFSVLHRRNVGLRVSEPFRRVAPQTQRCEAHLLSDRHPHAGELQPLAHDLQRPQPLPVRRQTMDPPMGRQRHLQRLSALRLADNRRMDGERTVRVVVQPAVPTCFTAQAYRWTASVSPVPSSRRPSQACISTKPSIRTHGAVWWAG